MRYQNNRQANKQQADIQPHPHSKTARFFSSDMPRSFNGDTWDAKHMTSFLNRSHYSNWKGDKKNISKISESTHKRSSSTGGDFFFKTTKQDRNESKIGFTPIFPLVSNAPIISGKQLPLIDFFNSSKSNIRQERVVSGKNFHLRCSPNQNFKFEGNAVKFQSTDPLTLEYEKHPSENVSGFQKQRMHRLIKMRHPHGMTGIDHPDNPEAKYYDSYQQKIRVRQQPNSHQTFLLDRQWKQKKRSVPPVDDWKQRKSITIRKFRNQNVHGFNILTNRMIQ